MIILSLSNCSHDSAAVIADDYNILAAVQTERITRKKTDGQFVHAPTIDAALRTAGAKMSDVEAVVMTNFYAPVEWFRWWFGRNLRYKLYAAFGKKRRRFTMRYRKKFIPDAFLRHVGAPGADFSFYGHHKAHALSALFFTNWDNALLYTADGGGDSTNYSAYHFDGNAVHELYGETGEEWKHYKHFPANSLGLAYGHMTRALGYKINRHEGKLTGLAAYGKPVLYEEMAKSFWVDEAGLVCTPFSHPLNIQEWSEALGKRALPEDAAASIQKLLEKTILKSISVYLERMEARHIGLAGGVFANVALNRRIAELPGVEEVFIFPAMGDEGLAVGGVYEYLLKRDGMDVWMNKRQRLKNVYWGGAFDDDVAQVFAGKTERLAGDPAETAAKLLADNKIVAIYCGRMEFGPRALGARSIMASALDKEINNTLNKRLTRTEFMPFAPVVHNDDAEKIFEINSINRYAASFMTITCAVRPEWRDKIPAVVHVDGTARPQIIEDSENPFYAAILRQYKEKTGIPVLINTSFNAHEEPIINTPEECLQALLSGRVDYVATPSGVYRAA